MVKQAVIFLLSFFLLPVSATTQRPDSTLQPGDSITQVKVIAIADSSFQDSIHNATMSVQSAKKKLTTLADILKRHLFLNSTSTPEAFIISPRKYIAKDVVFYILAAILLFLGILKVAWPRYFSNLIRVFFNTSLRQGQLTDQLLQARLPSLFFNIFFVLISGCYLYLLLNHFGKADYSNWKLLSICMIGLLLIYLIKFCTLKFAGWLTGYKQEAETYIF
ncbi:MAG: DUF4271 domain-containing protein, partial [Ferruginibacter sp.]